MKNCSAIKNATTFFCAGLLTTTLVACRASSASGVCGTTLAVTNQHSLLSASPGGGFLTIEGESISPTQDKTISQSQCTAFARLTSALINGYKGEIWTARHCLPNMSSRITKTDFRLFDGRNSYISVDIRLYLAEARNSFFDHVERQVPLFSDSNRSQKNPARLVLDFAFLEEEGKKNYGQECRDTNDRQPVPEEQICLGLQDFRIFDVEFSPKTKKSADILRALWNNQSKQQRKSDKHSLPATWLRTLKRQIKLEADISMGRFVDMIFQCNETTTSAVCAYRSVFEQLARSHRAHRRDLLAEAAEDGFPRSGQSYADFKRHVATVHYKNQLMPIFLNMQQALQQQKIKLHLASKFEDTRSKAAIFSVSPLQDFYKNSSEQLQFRFQTRDSMRDAHVIFKLPPEKSLLFSKGDSGSVLLMDEGIPFMVVSAKGDQSISGGASILALPEAKDEPAPPLDPPSCER